MILQQFKQALGFSFRPLPVALLRFDSHAASKSEARIARIAGHQREVGYKSAEIRSRNLKIASDQVSRFPRPAKRPPLANTAFHIRVEGAPTIPINDSRPG